MRIVVPESTREFLEQAGPLLLANEARHNLALGTLSTVVAHPEGYPEQHYWIVEAEGVVVGAALRTPPYNPASGRSTPRPSTAATATRARSRRSCRHDCSPAAGASAFSKGL